jgi:hypothetical protein
VEKPKIQQLLISLSLRIAAKSKLVHLHEATVWLSTTNFYALKKCSATLPAFADTAPLHP